MKLSAVPLVLFLVLIPSCAPDSAGVSEEEAEASQLETVETNEAPDAIEIDEKPDEVEPDPEPAPEPDQEPVEEERAEDSVPVVPVVDEIVFSCRSSRLTAEVHAKIPGTKASEGRYNWGIDSITAYRKNEYGAELDHEMKWDGAYDPQKDKWVSAETSINGARYKDIGDNVRFLIEGEDVNGNDVQLVVNQEHGTNC